MLVLDAGGPVKVLRFTPDGRRLLAGSGYPDGEYSRLKEPAFLDAWDVPDGGRRRIPLPRGCSWKEPSELAVTPDGEDVFLSLNGYLSAFRIADGARLSEMPASGAERLFTAPTGRRFVRLHVSEDRRRLALHGWGEGKAKWHRKLDAYTTVAGFLPDGDRFVTLEKGWIRTRSFAAGGEEVSAARYRVGGLMEPAISADGRLVASIGYGSLYAFDLTAPGKTAQIKSSSNFGDFRSFAFHPTNGTLAVIHGGPTLVKLYDATTLKLRHKFNWKLGPLRSVAFSPDGTLAAAGGDEGKIIVWDVDS